MRLYSPSLRNEIKSPKEFLDIYGAIYDYLNRNQELEDKVDALLEKDMRQLGADEFAQSIAEIIYWKVGGTHPEDLSRPDIGGWKIRYQYGEIDVDEVVEQAKKVIESPEASKSDTLLNKSLESFMSIPHMGPVYSITLVHFLSQGRLPIYDKFAHIAMLSICGEGLNGNSVTDCFYTDKYMNRFSPASCSSYKNIKKRYESYTSLAKKVYELLDEDGGFDGHYSRRIDKALWVYGHLFSESKATSNKIKIE